MHQRRIDGAPHEVVPRKGGVHHQDVADKLIVGAVIRDVVQHKNRVEKCDCKNENRFGNAKRHYMPHGLSHAGIISLGDLPQSFLETAGRPALHCAIPKEGAPSLRFLQGVGGDAYTQTTCLTGAMPIPQSSAANITDEPCSLTWQAFTPTRPHKAGNKI